MEHIEKLLSELPLFKGFPLSRLRTLIEESQLKTFAPQETIIEFGQPGRFLGVILDGEAEAVITGETGARQRIGTLKQGDFLGEISLLTGEPTSNDVIALEECELLLIPQEVFSTFLAVNPDALKVMAKAITERLKSREQDEAALARVEDAWRSAPDPYGLRLSTAAPMKILVVNCGSSSLKYSYFDTARETNNLEGIVDRIGLENSRIVASSKKGRTSQDLGTVDHSQAFEAMVAMLTDRDDGVVGSLDELTAVGHRVVHGGDRYGTAAIIDDEVIAQIEKNSSLAPLHNPLNLMAIKESMRLMASVPQVAVFDTGFHQKMPLQAYLYGLPYDLYEEDRIRRYGFHGISHNYVALQAAAHLKREFREMKIITCHLGNGASVCAIDHGRSVDTSMGLTPLEGLIMGTRSGDLDPSIVVHLVREKGMSIEEVDDMLNRESGLKGLSGISSDFRELEDAANLGDQRAILAIQVFCYRIRKYIGAYISALGGLDALIFTGGIGEGSAWVRSLCCQGLSYMGILLDDILNKTIPSGSREVADVSAERSRVKVLVIPTDEGRMIARETICSLGYQSVAQVIESQREKSIPVEVSAHHVHLSRRDVDALFGPGYELTRRADLSQPGQFACEEVVNLVGPRGRVERVRILGPVRGQSQVEISMTEEFKLGIKAPIRPSGDLDGSPGIILEGPKGTWDIPQGVICSVRHIHMSPEDALSFGLKDRDICMIRIEGERTLIFGDVLVRVNPNFRLSMHIDTDEANAASIKTGMTGHLVSVQDRR
jgi:acetate kinase